MALDWLLVPPAKVGMERMYEQVQDRLDALWARHGEAEDDQLVAIEREIAVQQALARSFAADVDLELPGAPPAIPKAASDEAGPCDLRADAAHEVLVQFRDDLAERLWVRHTAAEALALSRELITACGELTERIGDDDDREARLALGLLLMAATWVEFWAKHGFGFAPLEYDLPDD